MLFTVVKGDDKSQLNVIICLIFRKPSLYESEFDLTPHVADSPNFLIKVNIISFLVFFSFTL